VEIPKPSGADKERFRSLAPGEPRVEVKAMFGNLGAFVNGNMFMGLFGADIGVKLAYVPAAELPDLLLVHSCPHLIPFRGGGAHYARRTEPT